MPDLSPLKTTMIRLNIPDPLQQIVIRRLKNQWGTLPPRYNPNRTNSIAGQAIAPLTSFATSIAIRTVKSKIIELIQSQYQKVKPCQ